MEIKNKEWIDILGRNSDYHGDPLIILDDSFEIIFTNHKAQSLFSIDDYHITLEQVFEKDSVQQLIDYIGPVINKFQKKIFNSTSLNLKSGNSVIYDLSIEPLQTDENIYAILVFRSNENINLDHLLSKIKISSAQGSLTTESDQVKILISELQALAPFTVVSLKRVQNIIDQFDYPIWIKDIENKLIAINNNYAGTLGVENSFAAGKKHETFLPPHLKSIYKMLDEYVILNSRQIILEGFSKKLKNFEVIQSIIQVPLIDNFNRILAIIGLIVDYKYDYYNFWGEKEFYNAFINNFPKAAALINFDGIIKGSNYKFKEFFALNQEQKVDLRIDAIFPVDVVKKLIHSSRMILQKKLFRSWMR